jgi:hypothetical protein
MSLAEQLKKKPCKVERVTIDGILFVVTGKTKTERSELAAKARTKSGAFVGDKFDNLALESCVEMEDGSKLTADEWGGIAAHITGPLMSVVLEVCGFDKDDIQRDPKDSDSTAN